MILGFASGHPIKSAARGLGDCEFALSEIGAVM